MRELALGEEIVLGWEWAVEHVVHKLVRDAKLGLLPEDRRAQGILDLLRSLSMTCACKPDTSNCAISFGRMLLEAVDAQHAPELGPLVGYKRFEPTLHAVSSKTRRGRKSAARERKFRQAARPPSPPPKERTPPPKEPTPPVIKEPTPPREPTPVTKEARQPPLAKEPPPVLTPSPAKPGEESSKRGRPATVGRGKHRRRIESPSPEDDGVTGALRIKVESPNEPKSELGVVMGKEDFPRVEAAVTTGGNSAEAKT
ncbi:hypothetical protein RSAG8_07179, partial [Rhizoctonia solani AG-8 WAC10335]